jgi:DNA-binding MarR family transcriptional regulator
MPVPGRHQTEAAEALAGVAPLVSRWMERLLASHEPPLPLPQYLALLAVDRGAVSAAELARRSGVSPASTSQLLAALHDAGLLERRASADDRRRQELLLSRRGRAALRDAERLVRERLRDLLADVPPPEADALARLLPRVESALAGTAPPRRPPPPPRPPGRPPPPPPRPPTR